MAQTPPAVEPGAQTVTVTGSSAKASASIAGFGDLPLSRAPYSATVLNLGMLQDAGIGSIADLTRLDASTTDAYNAPGYWGQLAVRGFTLDNRFNYRRDGLPINAETVIAQDNKQSIEILKGTSGLQAGTSAPGGLVNLVVKRPVDRVRNVTLGWEQDGSFSAAADLGGRDERFGWRLNVSAERLDPQTHDSQGHRQMVAGAFEAQPVVGGLVEAEIEWSRQTQPSTPGFSLLGARLPDAGQIDPRINLNNQPWTQPVVMQGQTASLRYTQALSPDLQVVAHAMRQRLDSDDRVAFPYGCSAENDYTRYCSDGSFDLYDYRSDNERRTSDAVDLSLTGRTTLGSMVHRFNLGITGTRYEARFERQAYNWVGVGLIDGSAMLPQDPALTAENTNRDERSSEIHLQDAITLDPQWSLWAGVRHSQLTRESQRTDGTEATAYSQDVTTPWLALSRAFDRQTLAYLSWGQGIESDVAPNRARYTNAGQSLPALKSEQLEAGLKYSADTLDWRLAAFDIQRPVWRDIGACDAADSCTRQADGQARHTGLEAEADWRIGAWNLRGSAMLLKARREGSQDAALNGLKPTNVPASSLKAQAAYNVPAVPGLALLAYFVREGERMVLPDNGISTPGWSRLDLALRYGWKAAGLQWLGRIGVDNLTDRQSWQETPYQYDHAYLYPLAPRTWRASVQFSL